MAIVLWCHTAAPSDLFREPVRENSAPGRWAAEWRGAGTGRAGACAPGIEAQSHSVAARPRGVLAGCSVTLADAVSARMSRAGFEATRDGAHPARAAGRRNATIEPAQLPSRRPHV